MKIRSVQILAVLFALLVAPFIMAGGHKVVKPMVDIPVDLEVQEGVTKTLMATEAAWNSQDFAKILELWDEDQEFPTYIAEEQAQWFVGWDRLREYLDPPRPNPAIEALRLDYYDIQVKQIAPDLAIAIWYLHFEMKVIGSNPIGEEVRASGVFRKTDDGWKWIHYAESPVTAAVFLENLMEMQVRDDWDEFYEEAQKNKKEIWKRKRATKKATAGK
ncbi:MAG: nuclear transport factor 2 family protein [Gammaproteobacteria bacterium]|nr:nuclear transport factor 2 family protein [Gammaproteobacteria bacterium]MCP4089852.1 nuclear transport factor 2 family protein [Gammaproteobacteria bacterium]MCP4275507.1 nuclear transport factor 2 family protein [Gammaproteobacteria bacterium]MCP4832999.1 nuclear transport factor 2 family protein [Gammaproteobacteria bacterium]MCP4928629.1 nuclear transport factor 2 family protein [Gammaproteobacteria bacterium]